MSDEHHRGADVAAHVESIASRTDHEAERLGIRLLRRCWPGGASDRSEPSAREWVRRWGPAGLAPVPLACSCASGRCRLCN